MGYGSIAFQGVSTGFQNKRTRSLGNKNVWFYQLGFILSFQIDYTIKIYNRVPIHHFILWGGIINSNLFYHSHGFITENLRPNHFFFWPSSFHHEKITMFHIRICTSFWYVWKRTTTRLQEESKLDAGNI